MPVTNAITLEPCARSHARLSTPRRPGPVSLGAGGCGFVHDPTIAVSPELALWLPEVAPNIVILNPAPAEFDITMSIDPSTAGTRPAEPNSGDGLKLLVRDESGEVQVQWHDDQAARRPAVLLPLDGLFALRLDVAARFVRRLLGERVKLLPTALRLTPLQRSRFIQLLHAFDIHDAGGGPREVAAEVLVSEQARLPSVEWKDSHARRKANRLIHDSMALVDRGYLKLLRGG